MCTQLVIYVSLDLICIEIENKVCDCDLFVYAEDMKDLDDFIRWVELHAKEFTNSKIYVPTNPPGAETLPPGIVVSHTDLYMRRLWGKTSEVIANFSATWCGPCKQITPLFRELSEQYSSLMFLVIDVDELTDFSTSWEIRATPTFFFLRDG